MDAGDIALFVNSQALVAGGKTLDALINEKTTVSATGVGTTIFSYATTISLTGGSAALSLLAKFIPPMDGVYKYTYTANMTSTTIIIPESVSLAVFEGGTTAYRYGLYSPADLYFLFALGGTISAGSIYNYLAAALSYGYPNSTGSRTIYLSCKKGVPVTIWGNAGEWAGQTISNQVITYGNS